MNANKKTIKVRRKRGAQVLTAAILACTVFITLHAVVDFVKFPERYAPILRYQLENDLKNGNVTALEYYNANYVTKGVYLYGDRYTEVMGR